MSIRRICLALLLQVAVLSAYYALLFPLLTHHLSTDLTYLLATKLTLNFALPTGIAVFVAYYAIFGRRMSSWIWICALCFESFVIAFGVQVALFALGCGITGKCL